MILSRLAACRLSTECTHLDLGVLQWSKLVAFFGRPKMRQKTKTTPITESLHFICRQLFVLLISPQATKAPLKRGTLLLGHVRASGAPDTSREHPETAHEVFSRTRSSEPAAQKCRKLAKSIFPLTPWQLFSINSTMATYIAEKPDFTTCLHVCWFPRGWFEI